VYEPLHRIHLGPPINQLGELAESGTTQVATGPGPRIHGDVAAAQAPSQGSWSCRFNRRRGGCIGHNRSRAGPTTLVEKLDVRPTRASAGGFQIVLGKKNAFEVDGDLLVEQEHRHCRRVWRAS